MKNTEQDFAQAEVERLLGRYNGLRQRCERQQRQLSELRDVATNLFVKLMSTDRLIYTKEGRETAEWLRQLLVKHLPDDRAEVYKNIAIPPKRSGRQPKSFAI